MRIRKLMVCVGDPDEFPRYAPEVGWIARRLNAKLVLFHATLPTWRDFQPLVRVEHPDTLKPYEFVGDPALEWVKVEVDSVGGSFELLPAIFDSAEQNDVDVIVVPTHARKGIPRMVMGSVAERLIKACRVPVLTLDLERVPTDEDELAFDRVVAPVDLSVISNAAVPHALELARSTGCGLTLTHVVEETDELELDLELVTDFRERVVLAAKRRLAELVGGEPGIPVDHVIERGGVVDAVTRTAACYSNPVVVMGTAGRDSLGDHVLGSRTERVVRHAECSVLALPATMLR